MPFGGKTYDRKLDKSRLSSHMERIWDVIRDGKERSPRQVRVEADLPPDCAVTSRLRDFRKKIFGGYNVPCRRAPSGGGKDGRWLYRYIPGDSPAPPTKELALGKSRVTAIHRKAKVKLDDNLAVRAPKMLDKLSKKNFDLLLELMSEAFSQGHDQGYDLASGGK